MDVQTEILDLKLRVEALEAKMVSALDRTATLSLITALRTDLAELRADIAEDFKAWGDELAGVRRHFNDSFKASRSDLVRALDTIRCEMIDLGIRLDRLVEKDGA
ncbi:hypothetical protein MF672_039220 [Actinomadura sp. ATCC 31491]|uniref:WXG100 family type VII secretion target n=1 Tax=Actinomadura luzonensis TaxID=2805427 RepID=A0ABT0G5B0_9ACTN|nr:hypothetical protein [Actinomadura luzonensis]MCK2219786.1 hypothetical protein [Actinomadura luzonensis]